MTDLLLRRAFVFDAVVSGATGVLMAAAAQPLHEALDLPVALLRAAGLVLLPYAIDLAWFSRRKYLWPAAVWGVIATNAAWAVGSLGLLASGLVRPNPLGFAFVFGQAVAVALIGGLQWYALRRSAAQALPAPA